MGFDLSEDSWLIRRRVAAGSIARRIPQQFTKYQNNGFR